MLNISRFVRPAAITAAFAVAMAAGLSWAAANKTPSAPADPPYGRKEALRTIINPHNQINDEGEILWDTCVICHKNVPDVKKEHSIKDAQLRFEDDLDQLCRNCHVVKQHPGNEDIGAIMSGFSAPDHLVVVPKNILLNMRLTLKDIPTTLPLDPKKNKVICATCHNPHERGVLIGRADYGADYNLRLRSAGLDICEYCHRK